MTKKVFCDGCNKELPDDYWVADFTNCANEDDGGEFELCTRCAKKALAAFGK